jgi:2-dehydropantoate 2-reductase
MKIAIFGTGAMGSVYTGLLGSAGNDVWAIDSWAEHIGAIRANGLRLRGASGDRVVRVNATTNPSEVGEVDLLVIATKAYNVEEAATAALPLVGPDTVVLPIQNGLGSVDRAAAILGEERVIVGVVGGFGASIVEPGHAHHHGMELLRLGERSGPVSERVERIAQVWSDAGFNVRAFDDSAKLVWEKLICNIAYSGPCGLTGMTIGEILEDADASAVSAHCAEEAFAVARALGIALDFDEPVRYVRDFGAKITGARPSLLLDMLAGRRSEVGVINGSIPPLARELGLPAPVNETVTALILARERAAGST